MTQFPDYLDKLRKDIEFDVTLCDQALHFYTTWGLFSPREIDEGSKLLLKYIEIADDADCFDLGCGYGPLGITLAKLAPNGRTLMADKDFVAVDYANRNIRANNIANAEAILSNAFDQVGDRKFDCIVSNIPAKVGKELLQIILHDAKAHLKPGGQLYVVTVTGLRQFMKRHMDEIFGNYRKLKQGRNYTVARSIKNAAR
ncbi:MAG: methyltransferase [Granulosicoccaceae bacterium]|jgi:16S rRNA G1207 methylase RsmC